MLRHRPRGSCRPFAAVTALVAIRALIATGVGLNEAIRGYQHWVGFSKASVRRRGDDQEERQAFQGRRQPADPRGDVEPRIEAQYNGSSDW